MNVHIIRITFLKLWGLILDFVLALLNTLLCTYVPQNRKICDKAITRKQLTLYHFMTNAHYLHLFLSHHLIFTLYFSPFYMLHYVHMYICLHVHIHIHTTCYNLYEGEHNRFFFFWDCVTLLSIIHCKSIHFLASFLFHLFFTYSWIVFHAIYVPDSQHSMLYMYQIFTTHSSVGGQLDWFQFQWM